MFCISLINTLIIVSPLFTSVTVGNKGDLEHAAFGWPFPFVMQDLSMYDPPYPYNMTFATPWETPTSIHPFFFIASFVVVNAFIFVVMKIWLKRQKREAVLSWWEDIRKEGKASFIWNNTAACSVPIGVLIAFLLFLSQKLFLWMEIILCAMLFSLIGGCFGLLLGGMAWIINERKYQRTEAVDQL